MFKTVTIIGGGPTGLMAADILSKNNYQVTVFERKPSLGRKFLLAGRGGLNITHSEKIEFFLKKYGEKSDFLKPVINNFSPQDLQNWCKTLGEKTFKGSSGRVFPKSFKASPLLRAWLSKLKIQKVVFKTRHDWLGWQHNELLFKSENKHILIKSNITLLALGGASWPKLGSDGSWVNILKNSNIKVSKLQPSNCGFIVNWSDVFKKRFAGNPLKSIEIRFREKKIKGEFIITSNGIEGGVIYSISSILRETINENGFAELVIDLKPDLKLKEIVTYLSRPKFKLTTTNFLRKNLKLSDVAIGLLMELKNNLIKNMSKEKLAFNIKNFKLIVQKPFSIERSISTAGGVSFDSLDNNFMLIKKPNVYVGGEMIDWEAPTGGYLLQACISNGAFIGNAILKKYM